MPEVINVRPDAAGWLVQGRSFDNSLTFKSGAAAETAARRLAEQYAKAGRTTTVRIYLRDGSLAGGFLYQPDRQCAMAG